MNFSCVQGAWIKFKKKSLFFSRTFLKYSSFLRKCLAQILPLCSSWKVPIAVLERTHCIPPSAGGLPPAPRPWSPLLPRWARASLSSGTGHCLLPGLARAPGGGPRCEGCPSHASLANEHHAGWGVAGGKFSELPDVQGWEASCAVPLALNTHSSTFALTS